MRRSWVGYTLIGVILYAIFLFTFAPPAWVSLGVMRITGGTVALSDARGTLWSGDANLVASHRSVGRVHWHINPAWLLLGQIAASVDLSGPETTLSAKLRTGFRGIKIPRATGRLSPTLAAAFYSPLSLADPKGNIELRANDLLLTRGAINGDVNLVWRDAAVNMSDVRPLGNYELKLRGKDRVVDIALLTRTGSLNLAGKGSWLPFDGGRLEFSGVARAAGRQAELAPLLAVLGAQGAGEARLLIRTAFVLR